MTEAVRLLIWDLDETFWEGTLTEGGIKSVPTRSIAIVQALNRRGIMNSICSKNDRESVMTKMKLYGLAEEFIFPSIEWGAKGSRVSEIIAKAGLRPETVMFLDDNPGVRAEVAEVVPGLQIEDEHFVDKILGDRRFVGKPDEGLSRLQQYKVLESKSFDKTGSGMSNEDFLRQSEIKVKIDYHLDENLERIVELINRTNQLNFTKLRLPEDFAAASATIVGWSNGFNIQSGVVSVRDKYGDYGVVGFFMQSSVHESSEDGKSRGQLLHFCFSCRTLGMLVEQWVYNFLGKPRLVTVGEVLTDLSVDREIDWITLVDSFDGATNISAPRFPQITLYGGCEANAIAVYLQAHAKEIECYGNYTARGCFVRTASSLHLINMCDTEPDAVRGVANQLKLPLSRLANNVFRDAPRGTLFVINCSSGDAPGGDLYFRHKESGLVLSIEPPTMPGSYFMTSTKDEILARIDEQPSDIKEHVSHVYDYLGEHFDLMEKAEVSRLDLLQQIISLVPEGCKMIVLCDHDHVRYGDTEVTHLPPFTDYATHAREIAESFHFCGFLSFSDVLRGNEEIQLHGNHYNREVYMRMAARILETTNRLAAR